MSSAFSFFHAKEICNLETFGSNFNLPVEPRWFLHPFLVPLCLLGENEFNDLQGLTGLSRCSRELLWFRASFPAAHCFTSNWLGADWTAAGWKDGRTKSRIGMFLLLILLGQQEHWRSIWPEAVLQPDHRHKLTTCVLIHKPDKLPLLGVKLTVAGFVSENDKWEMQLWSNVVSSTEYKDVFLSLNEAHPLLANLTKHHNRN